MPIAWSYRVGGPSLLARWALASCIQGLCRRWCRHHNRHVFILVQMYQELSAGTAAGVTYNALTAEGLVDELAALAAKIPWTTGRPPCGRAAQFKAAD